jgi:hypothetical protein
MIIAIVGDRSVGKATFLQTLKGEKYCRFRVVPPAKLLEGFHNYDGVIFLYALNNRESFQLIQPLMNECPIPFCVAGTKFDLCLGMNRASQTEVPGKLFRIVSGVSKFTKRVFTFVSRQVKIKRLLQESD